MKRQTLLAIATSATIVFATLPVSNAYQKMAASYDEPAQATTAKMDHRLWSRMGRGFGLYAPTKQCYLANYTSGAFDGTRQTVASRDAARSEAEACEFKVLGYERNVFEGSGSYGKRRGGRGAY